MTESTGQLVRELNHAGLRVADIERSLAFYRDLLDGRVIRDAQSLDGRSRFVYIQLVNSVIELIPAASGDAGGWQHIAFLSARERPLEAIVEAVADAGHRVTVPARPSSSGNGRLAFFSDASGGVWELLEREEDIRIAVFENRVIKAVDHFGLRVSADALPGIKRLLEEQLSMSRLPDDGEGPVRWALGEDYIGVALRGDEAPPAQPLDYLALRVHDIETLRTLLSARGYDARDTADGLLVRGPDGEKVLLQP